MKDLTVFQYKSPAESRGCLQGFDSEQEVAVDYFLSELNTVYPISSPFLSKVSDFTMPISSL